MSYRMGKACRAIQHERVSDDEDSCGHAARVIREESQMFNRNGRVLTLCTLTSMLALGGCATSPTVQHVDLGAFSETPEPAMPRVNVAVASQMAQNALRSDNGIQLGAGDRFGRQVFASYVASLRMQDHNRHYAEVGINNNY